MIEILKSDYYNSLLVGIMMKESGTIALKNVEKLFQIPIYELSIGDPSAKDNLTDIIYKCVIGL